MTPPPPDLNLLSVVVAVLTIVIGPELALVLGTYSIILLGWFGGVILGVYRQPPAAPGLTVLGFVAVTLIVTLGITVPVAQVLEGYVPLLEAKGMLLPVAFAVPAVGHSWLDVGAWLWRQFKRRAGADKGADQ